MVFKSLVEIKVVFNLLIYMITIMYNVHYNYTFSTISGLLVCTWISKMAGSS